MDEKKCGHRLHHAPSSPPPLKPKRRHRFASCFRRSAATSGGPPDGDPRASPHPPRPLSPSSWLCCTAHSPPELQGRRRHSPLHRRHYADFLYDPLSYARNFDEGDNGGLAAEDARRRRFSSRLPPSPPWERVRGGGGGRGAFVEVVRFHFVGRNEHSRWMSKKKRRLCGLNPGKSASWVLDNAKSLACSLQDCRDVRSLRKQHACIFKHGLANNIYLGPKLLNCYTDFGCLPESRWMFQSIISRSVSLWNSALLGYLRAGHFEEVLRLYLDLRFEGTGVDSSTITFCLKSCIGLDDLELGRCIHVDAFKFGLSDNKYFGSSLVGFYFGHGNTKDAHQAFNEIREKDIVAYTALLAGYAQLGDGHACKAFEIASDMHKEGFKANRVTLVSLLHAAGKLGALKEGRAVHCYACRRGTSFLDEIFQTSLVDMYAKCGAIAAVECVLEQMGRMTVATWNAMISGFVRCGKSFEALECFSRMKQEEISPDSITIANVLSACSDLDLTQHTTSIHAYSVRRNIPLDAVLITTLIELYSKGGMIKRARELFDHVVFRDIILYNVMISGYLQNGMLMNAMETLLEMGNGGIKPNSATVLTLLSAFAGIKDVKLGKWVHGLSIRYGLQSDLDVCNQILHLYVKCGHINKARMGFNIIPGKDLASWTTMMMGYVNSAHADEAIVLFKQMLDTGEKLDMLTIAALLQAHALLGYVKPVREIHGYIHRMGFVQDIASINSLLSTYAKCGRMDYAEATFNSMTKRELASWNTMIAAYGSHGYCKQVLEVFNQMQRVNMLPDEFTYTSVLSACSHSGLVEEGWNVFNSLNSESSITPGEEHYCCMVDLLGRAGQLEEAYNFLKCSPYRFSVNAMSALLAACKVHNNTQLGEIIGRDLLSLEPQSSGAYALAANLYAQDGKWSKAAKLRSNARDRGLIKSPGCSFV